MIHTVLFLLFPIGKPLRRVQQFLVNLSAKEGYNLVLVDDLFDSLIEIGCFTVEETDSEVFGPLSRTKNEEETENNCQVVVLLDDLLPRVICGLGPRVRRLLRSQFHGWNQAIDNKFESEVEDGYNDEFGHDADFKVDTASQLVNLIVIDAALLRFEQIARFAGVFEHDDHQDQVEGVQHDRDK